MRGRKQVRRLPHEQVVVDPGTGGWTAAVRVAQPSPSARSPYPLESPPVIEALVDLLAGQEDVGAGQEHFQAAARQRQGPGLEGPHLLWVSRNHHLDGRGEERHLRVVRVGHWLRNQTLTSYHSLTLVHSQEPLCAGMDDSQLV